MHGTGYLWVCVVKRSGLAKSYLSTQFQGNNWDSNQRPNIRGKVPNILFYEGSS